MQAFLERHEGVDFDLDNNIRPEGDIILGSRNLDGIVGRLIENSATRLSNKESCYGSLQALKTG